MYSKLAPVLAIASLVSAAAVPVEKRDIYFGNRGGHQGGWGDQGGYSASASAPGYTASAPPNNGYYQPSSTQGYAPPSQTYGSQPAGSSSGGSSSGASNIFKFPTADGFPNVQNPSDALTQIEIAAHGTLPIAPPPPATPPPPPKEDDLVSLRLIAFNELFEVAYFSELLYNITNAVPGYEFQDQSAKQQMIDAITAVVAQEKEHTLNANGALAKFNAGPILPCTYQSPVSDLKTAISVARTFTDVVLGTLGDVQTHQGQNGDAGLIRGVAAVIGQEGEQNGFYRSALGLIPSAAPFLTQSAREFAFSALNQAFIVPGSCPNVQTINLTIFDPLSPSPQFLQPQDQDVKFSFLAAGAKSHYATNYQTLQVAFLNQQNVPVLAKLDNVSVAKDGTLSFSAHLPFNKFIMNGLTIAAVVDGAGPFNTINDVVAATQFGPSLIEIN
ncbi:hypothetical protein H2200_002211 [Cladophialophora chaetospira]|uniref:Sexual development protein n=1 Tax=Cladophialophora chaetospira TaxID=386627 RepID=A0AA39CNB2_9EURO|nr:hypothetical protein H2200_002211 [Cladophialophora chaetospira]